MNNMVNIVSDGIRNSNDIVSPAVIYLKKALKLNISEIIEEISSIKSNNVKLLYSVKACSNSEVIKYLSKYVAGFSVSSIEEYRYIKEFKNKSISATGFKFNNYLLNEDTVFYFNSIEQLQNFLESNEYKENCNIGIRIKAIRTMYSNKNFYSRFGFSISQLKKIELLKIQYSFRITDILIHQENKVFYDYSNLSIFINKILTLDILKHVTTINLGGGWDDLFLKKQLAKFITYLKIPNKYSIFIEPGSVIVRTAGILKAKVIDQETNGECRKVVLNTSQFNDSSWYVPRIIASNSIKKSPRMKTFIYGNTCYENDYFGYNNNSSLSIGSTVFLYPVGAYYFTTHRELHGIKFPQEYFL